MTGRTPILIGSCLLAFSAAAQKAQLEAPPQTPPKTLTQALNASIKDRTQQLQTFRQNHMTEAPNLETLLSTEDNASSSTRQISSDIKADTPSAIELDED